MKSVGKTSKGLVRKNNQDNYLNQTTKSGLRIIAVADGLGGHKACLLYTSYSSTGGVLILMFFAETAAKSKNVRIARYL